MTSGLSSIVDTPGSSHHVTMFVKSWIKMIWQAAENAFNVSPRDISPRREPPNKFAVLEANPPLASRESPIEYLKPSGDHFQYPTSFHLQSQTRLLTRYDRTLSGSRVLLIYEVLAQTLHLDTYYIATNSNRVSTRSSVGTLTKYIYTYSVAWNASAWVVCKAKQSKPSKYLHANGEHCPTAALLETGTLRSPSSLMSMHIRLFEWYGMRWRWEARQWLSTDLRTEKYRPAPPGASNDGSFLPTHAFFGYLYLFLNQTLVCFLTVSCRPEYVTLLILHDTGISTATKSYLSARAVQCLGQAMPEVASARLASNHAPR